MYEAGNRRGLRQIAWPARYPQCKLDAMPKAIWNGTVIAEAPQSAVEIVEGNVYFPAEAVRRELLQPSDTHTVCGWKGTASYYSIAVNGEVNRDAAWYYPEPKDAARNIAGRVAFWKGVRVEP
jgi:uncharacterized protein (DUF427 family)